MLVMVKHNTYFQLTKNSSNEMKKLCIFAAAALSVTGAVNAQTVEGSKLTDNISVTLKGGGITPLHGHNKSFWQNMRGVVGVELRKQITPVFGLGVEGEWTVNTSTWNGAPSLHNTFDGQYVGMFGTVNFNNLFAGYSGQPRVFEVEAVAGAGWLHAYVPKSQGEDSNSFGTKVGMNFNFNLGDSKAWTIAVKPAVVWNMAPGDYRGQSTVYYNGQHAAFELEAGVTYHFGNSNGTHSFAVVPPCDYSELNAEINALRAENVTLAVANADAMAASAVMAGKLDECLSRPATVVTQTKETNTLESVRYVFYRIGSSKITADQQPNVEMIADYLKHNPKATVEIKGYASQDGNLEFNKRLAAARAESVRTLLVTKYGIASSRVKAQGEGIGHMFKEDSWNRVAICILNEAE